MFKIKSFILTLIIVLIILPVNFFAITPDYRVPGAKHELIRGDNKIGKIIHFNFDMKNRRHFHVKTNKLLIYYVTPRNRLRATYIKLILFFPERTYNFKKISKLEGIAKIEKIVLKRDYGEPGGQHPYGGFKFYTVHAKVIKLIKLVR